MAKNPGIPQDAPRNGVRLRPRKKGVANNRMDHGNPTDTSDMAAATADSGPAVGHAKPGISLRLGHFRWVICALLLFGTTKNYMDRQVLGVLKTTLQHDFGWNEID